MVVATLALVGLLISLYLYLYKIGVFGALLCGSGSCEYVQSSPYAVLLGVPVAAWGALGYAALFAVSLAGLQPRFADDRRVALALLAIASGGVLVTAYLTAVEAFVLHAWCQWCLGSAAIITLLFLFTLAEIPRLGSHRG